jgi:hypothetical protein
VNVIKVGLRLPVAVAARISEPGRHDGYVARRQAIQYEFPAKVLMQSGGRPAVDSDTAWSGLILRVKNYHEDLIRGGPNISSEAIRSEFLDPIPSIGRTEVLSMR